MALKGEEEFCDLFQSADFDRFLKSSAVLKDFVLSKDHIPNAEGEDRFEVFNSREAFSDLLKSDTWDMTSVMGKSPPPSPEDDSEHKKEFGKGDLGKGDLIKEALLSSTEWVPDEPFADVQYEKVFDGVADPPAPKHDWDAEFFTQLGVPPPAGAALQASPPALPNKRKQKKRKQKKRIRKPRPKIVPETYVYVEPLEDDVLLGRGGRSNHHPGNKRYREEVKNLRKWYQEIREKEEKTDLSQCLVDYVHSYGGRFLEEDKTTKVGSWYIVPDLLARRKASQALREDPDPAKRAAKRTRHLKKKAREGTRKRRKEA